MIKAHPLIVRVPTQVKTFHGRQGALLNPVATIPACIEPASNSIAAGELGLSYNHQSYDT